MVPLFASHADDYLCCTIEDRMRDSGRGCGNHPIWVESQVDDFQFDDINRIFIPGYSLLGDCTYQQCRGEMDDSNSPFELVVLGVPVYPRFCIMSPIRLMLLLILSHNIRGLLVLLLLRGSLGTIDILCVIVNAAI